MRKLAVIVVAVAAVAASASAGTPSRRAVPILMYHVVAQPYRGAPNPSLYVARPEFASEVRWLAAHGFSAVTLGRVYNAWHGHATLPAKPIVLSFDDGYRSQYTNALPVLHARRWPGVLNLEVADTTRPWGARPRMVRAMIAAGWEVDAHTLTHPDLTTLDPSELHHQVAGSRSAIRTRYHVPVDFFCYPAGRYNSGVIAAVRAAGYLAATTVDFGLARPSEPYTLRRVRIDRGDGVAGLRSKLASLGVR
jgi:peptidoglycan/xylan/chitin deacetylase (PgdA/CDA1 family)